MKYDLHNPTLAARVIYDGLTNDKPIRIAAGETVRGVVLADHVVRELRRSAALGTNVDLDVTEAEEAEPNPAPAPASPYPEGQFSRPSSAPPDARKAPEATSLPRGRADAPVAPARGKKKRA